MWASRRRNGASARSQPKNEAVDLDAVSWADLSDQPEELEVLSMGDDRRMIEMAVDSGAEDVVAPKWFASSHPLNKGSKTGNKYRSATGHKIPNEG